MMTRGHATFVLLFLELFILIPGKCEVIIAAKDIDRNVNVTFPLDLRLLDDLHTCLCDIYDRCSAKYNEQGVCDDVTKYKYEIQNRAYYDCGKLPTQREIRCTLQESDYGGVVIQELNCPGSTVTLHWSNINEGIIFDDRPLCQRYCVSGCYCPAKTLTTKTSTDFSTMDSSSSFTSASATTTTEKYEDDIPQGVLIGALVGTIVPAIIILIVVLGVFLWKRKNQSTPEPDEEEASSFRKTQGVNDVRPSTQNGPDWMSIDPPHNILFSSPANYSHYVNDINGGVPSKTADQDTKDVKGNSVHQAKTGQLSGSSGNDQEVLDILKKYARKNNKDLHALGLINEPDKALEKGDNPSAADSKTDLSSGEGATASNMTSPKSANQSRSKPVVSRAYLMNRGVDVDNEDFDIVNAANLLNSM